MNSSPHAEATIRAYFAAIERTDPATVEPFLHPDVLVIEHPNRISPTGARYDRAALRAAGERGQALLASQRYAIRALIIDGARAAVLCEWTGTLHSGAAIRAQICSIIELKDGLVWRQEQYDCFE